MVGALVAALAAVFSAGAQAAPGNLDPTFSGDGKQTTDFLPGGVSDATATVRQPDGKMVAVGSVFRRSTGDSSISDFALARYNPNGTLDTSFSGDGRKTTDFAGLDDGATGVALQSDGKIVVVGRTGFGSPFGDSFDFAVARYNPNGTFDASFSGDGKQTASFGDSDLPTGVIVQGDGKIVAVGDTCNGNPDTTCDFALARFNANGSLDTSFSGDGKQTADLGDIDIAYATTLQGDGKIVVVGNVSQLPSGATDFALARFDSNGSLDTSFSGDGKQTTDFGSFNDQAHGVAIQADGKIVVAGQSLSGSDDFALARYNPNGSLDSSFSGDGRQLTDFGGSDAANAVALQGGKIVLAGTGSLGGTGGNDFALARYKPNGSLDATFSGNGKQTTDFGGSDGARAVALQTDGKIVAVGIAGGDRSSFFALARYNPNGSLDTSFSDDGKQTTSFGGGADGAAAVAIQANGKIVTVGHTGSDFAIARYKPNGSLDATFSGNGKQTTDFGGSDGARAVAIQANGKIVVVGRSVERPGEGAALARYNPNGTLDTSFSGDGKLTTDFGSTDAANAVALQADGKIVVVSSACSMNACNDFVVARYNANGTLDTSFSGDGRQTTKLGVTTGVAIQGDGKIIVVGYGGPDLDDFALARYNPNGSLDSSFSGDGRQLTDFGGSDAANAVALQGGKIVLAGTGSLGGTGGNDFALARYKPNGSLDTSFSGDGKLTTDFGTGDAANAVVLEGDGKIVAAGRGAGGGGYAFALARYRANGSLDPSFSGDGKQTTDFGFPTQIGGASGVALQGDGKIVAVGVGTGQSQTDDFAVARYLGG
jgi:uncharacterized delta-60 repeat protein